ncbi:MAG: transposase [Desulfobulbaceae bacterium]
MARPLRVQYPGALYHVTSRGNERKAIFKDDADRREFLRILAQSVDTYGVILHSFVLMQNHWHFLVQTPLGNLGEFMRHFNISYTSHYNLRHNRVGHLYQGRYKSFLVELDTYLSHVSRYIHLNPVKVADMETMPSEKRLHYLWNYPWSSMPGYITKAKKLDFVEYATVLAEYGGVTRAGRQRYQKQIIEDLSAGLPIKDKIIGQSILGSNGFVEWVRETFLESQTDRERPAVGKIHRYLSTEEVLALVSAETGIKDVIRSSGTTRQFVMTALYKYAGLNNREIGDLLGVDYSTVSQGRKRLRDKTKSDQSVHLILERLERKLSKLKI